MIKPVFDFFKIHRKMIFRNTSIVIQHVLGIGPESFNTINVILRLGKFLAMANRVMFPQPFQRTVAAKGVREIHRAFPCSVSNMFHQLISCYRFDHTGIHTPIALQEPPKQHFSQLHHVLVFLYVVRQSRLRPIQFLL